MSTSPSTPPAAEEGSDMMLWHSHDLSAWGWVGMVAFWALLIAAVVWIARGLDQRPAGSPSSHLRGPEQLLAERFARGEIEQREFIDRRAALRGDRRPATRS